MIICPCCGYEGLSATPYKNAPSIPETRGQKVPYRLLWGAASYELCSCCGFHFGADDEPNSDLEGATFEEHLDEWIAMGCNWLYEADQPANWDLEAQLRAAGIEKPDPNRPTERTSQPNMVLRFVRRIQKWISN